MTDTTAYGIHKEITKYQKGTKLKDKVGTIADKINLFQISWSRN